MAAREPAATLVLDLDQTLVARDARTIAAASRDFRTPSVTYSHQSLATQPLLAIPDVIAWFWARGANWRQRVAPVIANSFNV